MVDMISTHVEKPMSDNAPKICRELMGKIVDEVFDGAIEDCSVIEEIYAAIKRHEADEHPTTTAKVVVPEGWALVPIKPSREMTKSGEHWSPIPEQVWQDMIDAAPLLPALNVTGEMIEAACAAIMALRGYEWPSSCNEEEQRIARENMSAAIKAAIDQAPAPAPQMMPSESPWQWWAGEGEEWLTVGPEDTREAIISAATNDRLGEFQHDGGGWNLSFYIVEARKDPLRLADWIHDCDILDHAEDCLADSDRVASEFDEGPWFKCSAAQKKDLQERINRACDEWQAAHGLAFSCATFSHTRNEEHVIVELHDDRNATEVADND